MIQSYFGITISSKHPPPTYQQEEDDEEEEVEIVSTPLEMNDLYLKSLPNLLPPYTSSSSSTSLILTSHYLPKFLSHLLFEVDYENEMSCFERIAIEIAYLLSSPFNPTNKIANTLQFTPEENQIELQTLLRHVIVPAMRKWCIPPPNLLHSSLKLVISQEELYKSFERC